MALIGAVTLINNTATKLCTVLHRRELDNWQATLLVSGSFGGGTALNLFVSPDNGTTLIPLKNNQGTVIAPTATNYMDQITLGNGSKNTDRLTLWGQLVGSTSPTALVSIYDNG